jgi:purine nucleoside phosphorylase
MVPGESATLMLATGTCETVIDEVPVWLSLVAVIVAVPMVPEAAVTRPLVDTVATALLLDDQVTVRPVSTL